MNIIFWFILCIVTFCSILLFFKIFGKMGLFLWCSIAIILANIQVIKTIELFGIVTTLGNIIYGSSYLVTDILSELYGKKEANKAVYVGLCTSIIVTIIMFICLLFVPHVSDFSNDSLKIIFGIMPRVTLASLLAYFISNKIDIYLFHKLRKNEKKLWLRNCISTISSQFLDTIIFCSIAFVGLFELNVFIQILLSTYLFKVLTALLDTPFIYIARKIKGGSLID